MHPAGTILSGISAENQHRCPKCETPVRGKTLEGLCPECARQHVLALSFSSAPPEGVAGVSTGSSPAPASQTYGPGAMVGPYRLVEKIGEGGFGSVYRADQTEPIKRQVALKIIKFGMDTEQVVTRFEAERQALALMDHPNIAHVLDAGATESGSPFFVMELVIGKSIIEYCEENRLSIRDRLRLLIQVCQAVQHAHQKGVIHRDLKPSNILVALPDDEPLPKVIDFGIAKATQLELTEKTLFTQLNHFVGTPAYMSPEQMDMSGVDVDTRSDVYSLGVLLYQLLTGSIPFDTTDLNYDQIRQRVCTEEPLSPSVRLRKRKATRANQGTGNTPETPVELRQSISRDIDNVVMKALEKDRTRRYQTATELAQDIGRYLNNEPVLAVAASPSYRFQKLVRRHRGAFAAAAIILTVLILGAVASTLQAIRATRSEQKESLLREAAQTQAYAADMGAVQHALSLNNVKRARAILKRHEPTPDLKTDLRGWEWRYLWARSRSDHEMILSQGHGPALSVSVSDDGKQLAVGQNIEGQFAIWDLDSRKRVKTLDAGQGLVEVAFAPDNRTLAVAGIRYSSSESQSFVRLLDVPSSGTIAEMSLNGEIHGMDFSATGEFLATYTTTDSSSEFVLWRTRDAARIASRATPGRLFEMSSRVVALADDLTAAVYVVSKEGTVEAVEPRTGVSLWTAEKVGDHQITALTLSPDGKKLALGTAWSDTLITLRDMGTGQVIHQWKAHSGFISTLEFSEDGDTLFSAGADHTISIWNISDLPNLPEPRHLRGHEGPVLSLDSIPGTTSLVSGSDDGSVRIWATDEKRSQRARTEITLPKPVLAWSFPPEDQSVLTLNRDGTVIQWTGKNLDQDRIILDNERGCLSGTLSEDGRWAAMGTESSVELWDLWRQTRVFHSPSRPGQPAPVKILKGPRVVVFNSGGSQEVWNLSDPANPVRTGVASRDARNLSRDERWVLKIDEENSVSVTDTVSPREIAVAGRLNRPTGTAFSWDGKFFAISDVTDKLARVWETETGTLIGRFGDFRWSAFGTAFSPDGKRLVATSSGPEAVRLWDLESHHQLIDLEADGFHIWETRFSPDGNLLGGVNNKGILKIWRAPSWEEIEGELSVGGP